jgi:hypothetical protein
MGGSTANELLTGRRGTRAILKKNRNPVTGYKYSFGIHMGIGRGPINEVVAVKVGDKIAWSGSQTESGDITINQPELFGGDKSEGGIVGTLKIMMGELTQKAPDALVKMLGHALPGFRRMATCFYDGQISSNSAYPKAWKLRVRRTTKGWQDDAPWYPEKAMIPLFGDPVTTTKLVPNGIEHTGGGIGGWEPTYLEVITSSTPNINAMNAAHILYECMTNREWGRGLPSTALDNASFTRAADTLFDEGFGLCLRWTRRDSLESFVQSVLDHIGATMYSDRQTSLITLKLIRKDYDATLLPIYDTNSGLLEITENEVSSLGPAVNEVVVEYTDPVSGETRTKNAQNLASLQASRGVFNSTKKSYPGIPTDAMAARIAQRDLRVSAIALRRFTIKMDRSAWKIAPGDVFRIRDVNRGILDMIVRVGRVEDGTLTNGIVTITAVQDVFGLPQAAFTGTQPPSEYKPITQPVLGRHRAFEVPYFMLSGADLADDAGFLGTVAEKPTDVSLGYTLYVKSSEPTSDEYPPSGN